MLTWERKKYLAKGHYISEEAEIKSNQRIVIEYFLRPGNKKWEARAHYFIADERIKFFLLEDVSSIEAVRAEAYKRVHDYVEDKKLILFLVTKYASKYMQSGVVINVSSLDATETYSELSMDYCASKAALNNLTKTLSLALPNINVTALALGWVKTDNEINHEYSFESESPDSFNKGIIFVVDKNNVKQRGSCPSQTKA